MGKPSVKPLRRGSREKLPTNWTVRDLKLFDSQIEPVA
jgi:hypothetical protein